LRPLRKAAVTFAQPREKLFKSAKWHTLL
jgi:hypothetical protein